MIGRSHFAAFFFNSVNVEVFVKLHYTILYILKVYLNNLHIDRKKADFFNYMIQRLIDTDIKLIVFKQRKPYYLNLI